MSDDDGVMVDEYLDCAGKTRRFRIEPFAEGLFLSAVELRDDPDGGGFRIVLPIADGELPPYGEIRRRIRERISRRDLVWNKQKRRWQVLRDTICLQVDDEDDEGTPMVLVDDTRMSWTELGKILKPYNGFGLRLQIVDAGDE